ncbi:type I glyceraldehyde-3-phosphate dehydrogenase [Sulfitobacter sp. SK012]|uniref:type I glyceraldehyde-3-phosphate dehydrogenase n=1 Tax=Sulfitobacter sp. SK012 TaxID=1389005 RepID=UPI000E0BFDED|nr:type I glyceraldehyde-3-phosphate dehydrogenase [Sulfitobacter sp. SK012]AXI48976.1 type I glyceraldehyde-3-phosphate dehydrogenase [Sulfitobacter sp. SK012]
MALKIAINGFGRIGRNVLRALVEYGFDGIEVVAINDLAAPETLLHLLKYDSVHGRLKADAKLEGDVLHVAGQTIRLTAERDPKALPWGDVDIAYECTGLFTQRDKAAMHLENGSKRVLISAPGKGADRTIVFGVNEGEVTAEDTVVSNASCTTNCLAPMVKVLDDAFGIETGYMTTIHAYTGDQPSHDTAHRDPYRGRAAALSMVPTSTGAATAISLVIPHMKGRLEGSAVRVPTANVSLVDLSFMPSNAATIEAVNAAMQAASNGPMGQVLSFEADPLVSVDFNHDPHSSCFAPAQTKVTEGGMVRVVSWYDNEWGFSNRMNDTARLMGQLMQNHAANDPA